jgi:hypothetical protein
VQTIAQSPQFYGGIGLTVVIVFLPLTLDLLIEWRFHTHDMVPGADLVLPAALVISFAILLVGIAILFLGTKYASTPGSFLYRATHIYEGRRD